MHLDPDTRAVLTAIWRAGAAHRRDVDGEAMLEQLEKAGVSIEERMLHDLLIGLRDDGVIDLYVTGTHKVADMVFIRLEPETREVVADFPEVGGGQLERPRSNY